MKKSNTAIVTFLGNAALAFAQTSHLGAQSPSSPPPPAAAALAPAASPASPGVVVDFKDGKSVTASALKREGNNVLATVPMSVLGTPGTPPASGEGAMVQIGYPVATVAKIEFPEPPEIKSAANLLELGKASEALAQILPVVTVQQPFRDVPGNFWLPAATVELNALIFLKDDAKAEALIGELQSATTDPEIRTAGKVQLAAAWVRKRDYEKALPVFEAAINECKNSETLAAAWLNKGHILLAKKEFEPALLAYLHLPVFYSDQKLLMPAAILGSARAYIGIESADNARKAFDELIQTYPAAPEAAAAKKELAQLNKS